MSVSLEEVRHVAELANLQLTAEEEPHMQHNLNAVLGYIAQLSEVNTAGVEPMAQVAAMLEMGGDLEGGTLRVDAVRASIERRAVMVGAPDSDWRFFKVPKVIER